MNQKIQPLVSVITPVYNGENFLGECIESVLAQSYENWEYIIVNNCSTDRSLAIAEKYAEKDARIKIFSNEQLLPIMKNWNYALSKISHVSKYCKVVHADDLLFPRCIEQMVSLAETHPTVGVVGSYGLWGQRVVCDGLPHTVEFLSGKELCRLTLLNRVNCFWSPSSLLIRSDLIRKRHCFYNEKIIHADVETCYEILKESDFGFVHQVLTFIRRHEQSVTSVIAAPFKREILNNMDLFLKFGPIFLSKAEYNRHLTIKTRRYYNFLALSLFRLREKKFWRYHKNTLEEMGVKLRYSKLMYSGLRRIIKYPYDTCSILLKQHKEIARRR